jgi:alpha-beta hydrolase superfamily lysophospholipase
MANHRDEAGQHDYLARFLEEAGYAVLRFDFRGCGESGVRGRMLIGSEWPQDLQAAVTFLQARPEVDPSRIAAVGSSWGGGVTIYTAAQDRRLRCAVSLGAPANGERWLHFQWSQVFGEEGWKAFLADVAEDRLRCAQGQPSRTVRLIGGFIPVPPDQIPFFDRFLAEHPYIVAEIPLEIAEDILAFAPEKVVYRIAPTPLLMIHGTADPVVDYHEALKYYELAGEPKELHLIEGGVHQVLLGETAGEAVGAVLRWLERYL